MNEYLSPEDAFARLAQYIFIQACKDMMGMDGASARVQHEAEEWLLSPVADAYAGKKGAGQAAVASIKEDPEAAKQRFLAALNSNRSH